MDNGPLRDVLEDHVPQALRVSAGTGGQGRGTLTRHRTAARRSRIPPSFYTAVADVDGDGDESDDDFEGWRTRERKMKTLKVGLVLCLNIGVDPPDGIKTNPGAKLMCWIDPTNAEPAKVIDLIGQRMAEQYKKWQPKLKCKQALDPTLDDVKRICCSMRRRAKDEPVLFHYNGLGVPRPTANGELWVFNRSYTQYLPLSVYDLQSWLQGPSVYVYDCSGAGVVIDAFLTFVEQRRQERSGRAAGKGQSGTGPGGAGQRQGMPDGGGGGGWLGTGDDSIQLAACGASESLPTLPSLPADLFTSCLTTPIETSLRWAYASGRKHMLSRLQPEMIDQAPGQLNDRRTMLGQLNWIFTAITDTIAWNVLPKQTFHRLFRNDLLVAALFRNFLLADRIMRSYGCTPVSHPRLPSTHNHPLWAAWDLAQDTCLAQLPDMLENGAEFEPSPFFSDQLTAFDVWLSMQPASGSEEPPEQLPIVLQVLLSQQHRLRALHLLERFLSLGRWAVRRALSVGIFPYVFKLLGSPSPALRHVLTSLWAKILPEDPKCKVDLLKSAASPPRRGAGASASGGGGWKAFNYFVQTVVDVKFPTSLRALAAFVLAIFADDHPKGQRSCIDAGLIESVVPQLQAAGQHPVPEQEPLRVWLCMALAKTWSGNASGRTIALESSAVEALVQLLTDPMPRVRAVAVYALGQLIGPSEYSRPEIARALTNYEAYHGLKPGTATIAQVESTSAGVAGWAKQIVRPERALIMPKHQQRVAGDTDGVVAGDGVDSTGGDGHGDKGPSSAQMEAATRDPGLLWNIFGRGIGLELLHCLEDGSHAVRLEAAYALTALVAFFKDEFTRVAAKEKPGPPAALEMRRVLVSQLLLAGDPLFAVGAPSIFSLKSIGVRTESRGGKGDRLDIIVRSALESPQRGRLVTEAAAASGMLVSPSPGHGASGSSSGGESPRTPRKTPNIAIPPSPSRSAGDAAASVGSPMVGSPLALSASVVAHHGGGAFVWHKAGISVVAEGAAPPVPKCRGDVEEIAMKIAEVAARASGADRLSDAELEDAMGALYDHILDAGEASPAVETELQRAGWSASEFSHAGIDRYCELAAHLQEAAEMSPEHRSKTALMPWYRECLLPTAATEVEGVAGAADGAGRATPAITHSEPIDELREWREDRYARLWTCAVETARRVEAEGTKFKMDDVVFHTPTKEVTDFVQFHPSEPYVVLANRRSGRLVVWRTDDITETASWFNAGRSASSGDITSMRLINEHDDPLLAVGTSNGLVRLWSGWSLSAAASTGSGGAGTAASAELRTGWRAVHKLKKSDAKSGRGAGLVLGWNQAGGRLYAGGDVPYVQVWDATSESRCQKIETGVSTCLTSLCVLPDSNGLLGMGFGNGHVVLCDPRLPADQCHVQRYEQHKAWVVNVHLQRLNANHIISGSEAGDILWWDPRFPGQAVRNLLAYRLRGAGDRLSAMVVHDFHSLIATATPKQFTKIYNLDGELLDHYKGKVNFVGEPFGSTSCLGFHQFDPLLASGSHEKIVTVCRGEAKGSGK